jgi:hypothetical protein
VPICKDLLSSWWSPEIGLHLLLRAHIIKFLNSYLNHPTSFGFESKVIMDLNDLGYV